MALYYVKAVQAALTYTEKPIPFQFSPKYPYFFDEQYSDLIVIVLYFLSQYQNSLIFLLSHDLIQQQNFVKYTVIIISPPTLCFRLQIYSAELILGKIQTLSKNPSTQTMKPILSSRLFFLKFYLCSRTALQQKISLDSLSFIFLSIQSAPALTAVNSIPAISIFMLSKLINGLEILNQNISH